MSTTCSITSSEGVVGHKPILFAAIHEPSVVLIRSRHHKELLNQAGSKNRFGIQQRKQKITAEKVMFIVVSLYMSSNSSLRCNCAKNCCKARRSQHTLVLVHPHCNESSAADIKVQHLSSALQRIQAGCEAAVQEKQPEESRKEQRDGSVERLYTTRLTSEALTIRMYVYGIANEDSR